MIGAKKNTRISQLFAVAAALCCIGGTFFYPRAAASGVMMGLVLCYNAVLPSIFPFLVLTHIITGTFAKSALGAFLLPVFKPLKIGKSGATAAMLGALGGFVAGAAAANTLYEQGAISADECQTIIGFSYCYSPAFIVNGVGFAFLGSSVLGGALLFALTLAAYLSCWLANLFLYKKSNASALLSEAHHTPQSARDGVDFIKLAHDAPQTAGNGGYATKVASREQQIAGSDGDVMKIAVDAIKNATNICVVVCGFIVFFNFLFAMVNALPISLNLKILLACLLESTTGCRTVAEIGSGNSIYLCAAALSTMGLSALFQVRTLLNSRLSLAPLLLNRILHLPITLAILYGTLKLLPGHVSATINFQNKVTALNSVPNLTVCVLFLVCVCFVYESERAGRKSGRTIIKRPKR